MLLYMSKLLIFYRLHRGFSNTTFSTKNSNLSVFYFINIVYWRYLLLYWIRQDYFRDFFLSSLFGFVIFLVFPDPFAPEHP